MKYILGRNAMTLFVGGRQYTVEQSHARFGDILQAIKDNDESRALSILSNKGATFSPAFSQHAYQDTAQGVLIDGELLPEVLSEHCRRMVKMGLDLDSMIKFWHNIKNNAQSVVGGLFDFLAYKNLPITEDGCFLAYKGLQSNYWSIKGNTKTIVESGLVNSQGQIFNGIGEKIRVARRCVDDNRNNHCGEGVHVGSLDYANGWGQRTVVVKVNPADVVTVPNDCSGQKMRCLGYEVISDYKEEIVQPAMSSDGQTPIMNESKKELNAFTERVSKYLQRKIANGHDQVTFQQIKNSFSPKYPSDEEIVVALNQLGVNWKEVNGRKSAIL